MEYEYVCEDGHELRVRKPMTAPHPTTCECGKPLRRVYQPAAVNFRGSGFYTTDKVLSDPADE